MVIGGFENDNDDEEFFHLLRGKPFGSDTTACPGILFAMDRVGIEFQQDLLLALLAADGHFDFVSDRTNRDAIVGFGFVPASTHERRRQHHHH
jgi:hypothetical protein